MLAASAEDIIRLLSLDPHPEGGHYVELFRAPLTVASTAHGGVRSASTAIYFLLKEGELSALHRVRSDEVWHHYAGDAIELHAFDLDGNPQRVPKPSRDASHAAKLAGSARDRAEHTLVRLGRDLIAGERPVAVIPAGVWQAARVASAPAPRCGYALCGCTVAPGFDFADFELPSREEMLATLASHGDWVRALTRG
jgi:hypothetical protein